MEFLNISVPSISDMGTQTLSLYPSFVPRGISAGALQRQPTLVSQVIKPRCFQVSSHSASTLALLLCGLGFGCPAGALGSSVFIPGSLLGVYSPGSAP